MRTLMGRGGKSGWVYLGRVDEEYQAQQDINLGLRNQAGLAIDGVEVPRA
jgi:hypothetical protein